MSAARAAQLREPIDLMRRRKMTMGEERDDGPPISCVTGNAKTIGAIIIADVQAGKKERKFLSVLYTRTFGDGGRHRKAGHAEDWCFFDLAEWAEVLECSRSQVAHVRASLLERRMIWYEANPGSVARIGWNLALDEWEAATYGGKRAGAGRKSNQVVNAPLLNCAQKPNQVVNEIESSRQCMPGKSVIKSSMDDSLEVRQGQDSTDGVIKVPNKGNNPDDTNVSSDAASAAVSKSSSSRQAKTPKATTVTRTKKKANTGEEKPAKSEEDLAWLAFHTTGLGLLEARYATADINYGAESKGLKRLYEQNHATIEELCDFWDAALLDPRYETQKLTMTYLQSQFGVYRRNPAGYRKGMQNNRDRYNAQQQRSSAHGSPTNARTDRAPAVAHHEPAANRSNLFNDD